jgi:hypothetical protein
MAVRRIEARRSTSPPGAFCRAASLLYPCSSCSTLMFIRLRLCCFTYGQYCCGLANTVSPLPPSALRQERTGNPGNFHILPAIDCNLLHPVFLVFQRPSLPRLRMRALGKKLTSSLSFPNTGGTGVSICTLSVLRLSLPALGREDSESSQSYKDKASLGQLCPERTPLCCCFSPFQTREAQAFPSAPYRSCALACRP